MSDPHPHDPTRGRHGNNRESNEAHDSIKATKQVLRNRIVKWIERRGLQGATSDEVEVVSGLTHQTVSARLTEAKKLGLLEPNGERRLTRSGRSAAVLIRTDKPIED